MVFRKKGCWILTPDTSRVMQISFEVRRKLSIKINKLMFGLEEEVKIPGE